jgi:quinol monooxygenase YgiN
MVKVALFVRLEAKPGKEEEVENLLKNGLSLVEDEPGTAAWFGIRLGRSTFGIFDAFPDEEGRQAHLAGPLAKALMAKAPDLLTAAPMIEEVDVLGAKLPGARSWKTKTATSKVGAAVGIVGIAAAGWFAARRYFAPSTPYEALEKAPVTSPM